MSTQERHNDWDMVSARWDYECSALHQTKAILQDGDFAFPAPHLYISLEHPPYNGQANIPHPAIHSRTFQPGVQAHGSPHSFQHFPNDNTGFGSVDSRVAVSEIDVDSTNFSTTSTASTPQWAHHNLLWDASLKPSPTTSTSSVSSPEYNTHFAPPVGQALLSPNKRARRPKPIRTHSEPMVPQESRQSSHSRQSSLEEPKERKPTAHQLHSKVEQSYRNRLNDTIDALAKQLFDAQGQSSELCHVLDSSFFWENVFAPVV